jgi:uncharacterized caspase-like protein
MIPIHLHAVCVGINQYQDSWIPSLRFAENDASSFASALRGFLERRHDERALWAADPNKDVVTLLGQEASLENINHALTNVFINSDHEAEIAFFYFSGHGMKNPATQSIEAYFGNVDIDPFKPEGTGLKMNDFYESFILRAKAKVVIVVVDCCYSGHVADARYIDDHLLSLFQRKEGIFIMTSSSSNQITKEDVSLQRSPFTHYLVQGLNNLNIANPITGELTIPSLFNYASSRVKATSTSQGEPHFGGRGTNFVLRRYTPYELWGLLYNRLSKMPGKPSCRLCGDQFHLDNMNICMSCGSTYCFRCSATLESVKETVPGFQRDSWWRCPCGGLIN